MKIFVTGESGVIPMALQKICLNNNIDIINSQFNDKYKLKQYKHHQSFKIRELELDFCNRNLFFNKLKNLWNDVDIMIHSGAYVGTDFCSNNPIEAIRTNVEGTKNIVDLCNLYNIKLLYFSTTAIFDPKQYSELNPITEHTTIEPQTLYGITKYAGEQIVKKECKTEYCIIRPVFGYSDFPDDLHSALTKVIYTIYYNIINHSNQPLVVLLNKEICKSYTRVENIANVIITMLKSKKNIYMNCFNVGESYKDSLNWHQILKYIIIAFEKNSKNQITHDDIYKQFKKIEFVPEKDYLHYHNIKDDKLQTYNFNLKNLKNYIDISSGIEKVCKSVLQNISIKPYWL